MNGLKCNVCGKEIYSENGVIKEDFVEIRKNWGYFSKKDGETHRFIICEGCYDKRISLLKIPVEITETKELL